MTKFDVNEVLRPVTGRPLRRLPRLVIRSTRLLWAAAPRVFTLSVVLQGLAGAGVVVQLLAGRRLLDHVLSSGTGFTAIIPTFMMLSTVTALVAFANVGRTEQQRVLTELVASYATDKVLDVATRAELIAYETPGFHDRLERAKVNAVMRPVHVANGLVGLLSGGFAIIGVGVALFLMTPLFLALVLLAYIPTWLASVRASKVIHEYAAAQTERDRRRAYLLMTLTGKHEAQEIRAFNLGGFLRAQHSRLYGERIADLQRVVGRRLRLGFVGALVTSTLTATTLASLVWFVTSGRMTIAAAGASAGAVVLLGHRLQAVAGAAAALYEGSLFLEDFTDFVDALPDLGERKGTVVMPARFAHLSVRDLYFTYPSREQPTLRGVSLDIRDGEVVAIVGENGSGKTTLAKLLAGLYTPDGGCISWDGVDIAKCAPEDVRDAVAVIFQDFLRYHLSARENIAMGRHERRDDGAVVDAARRAGAHELITALSDEYRTRLGPHFFGGSDLSLGQWQRVALARAFFRDSPFVILDEPTASLDPRAEATLFADIRLLCEARSVLLISHRFSSVRTADRIYVMRHGKVIEHGGHDELMAGDGHYAELFRLQAANYMPLNPVSLGRES